MSPQLQKAAFFVVEDQVDVATRSQRFIAQSSGLPAPNFTRLARAMGMQTYDEMRDICRQDIADIKQTLSDRASHLNVPSNDIIPHAPLVEQHISAGVQNIRSLVERIDTQLLEQAGTMLAEARRVYLIGELSSRALVEYASYIANLSLTGWKALGRSTKSLSSRIAGIERIGRCTCGIDGAIFIVPSISHTILQIAVFRLLRSLIMPWRRLSPSHSTVFWWMPKVIFSVEYINIAVDRNILDMTTRKRGADAQRQNCCDRTAKLQFGRILAGWS